MTVDRIAALTQAIELTPQNATLRLLLAEALDQASDSERAIEQYELLLEEGNLPVESCVRAGELALDQENVELAVRCRDAARAAGLVDGLATLEQEIDRQLADQGIVRIVHRRLGPLASDEEHRVRFADVGGLEDVKKVIHRTIILPHQRPDIYRVYGRKSGGGVMLFGPPGCGKTILARATAGECGLPFQNIRIEDILEPWIGMSERNLHDAFDQARAAAPCVVFIDELDALAFARRKQQGSAGRALTDQLLQEFDAIGAENEHLLILAATNSPWDVDDGLKRPGRFDRVIFVPPPDLPARKRILELLLVGRPAAPLDLDRLARNTPLFSGADLHALVERSVDRAIDEALASDEEVPLTMEHLEAALSETRPSTLEWLATARNYAEFANQGGYYDDVAAFLRTREARSARG